MKKFKKHIKRLHKIKIHDNRWLAWAIALTVIACFALWSYIKVTDYAIDYQAMDSALITNNGLIYKDNVLGFSLYHPRDWGVESDVRTTIIFNDPQNNGAGMTVSLYEPKDESQLRKSLKIAGERDVILNGEKGKRLIVSDGQKTVETMVLVQHEGRLYVIRGNTPWFDHVLSSFRFDSRSM
jgi:hypothetical protein